tara:strand:- start:986 stop:1183 length:198 start_codon:yes stop_codon:yes gene_type:complete
MGLALHSLSYYEEIVTHASLKLMSKRAEAISIGAEKLTTAKEQSDAFRRAWIGNTEERLLKRKTN